MQRTCSTLGLWVFVVIFAALMAKQALGVSTPGIDFYGYAGD